MILFNSLGRHVKNIARVETKINLYKRINYQGKISALPYHSGLAILECLQKR
jgi:hypothetical protein